MIQKPNRVAHYNYNGVGSNVTLDLAQKMADLIPNCRLSAQQIKTMTDEAIHFACGRRFQHINRIANKKDKKRTEKEILEQGAQRVRKLLDCLEGSDLRRTALGALGRQFEEGNISYLELEEWLDANKVAQAALAKIEEFLELAMEAAPASHGNRDEAFLYLVRDILVIWLTARGENSVKFPYYDDGDGLFEKSFEEFLDFWRLATTKAFRGPKPTDWSVQEKVMYLLEVGIISQKIGKSPITLHAVDMSINPVSPIKGVTDDDSNSPQRPTQRQSPGRVA